MTEDKEFCLSDEREKLFKQELLGKPNGGRIYRMIISQDKETIKILKEKLFHRLLIEDIEIIDKIFGERLTK